MKFTALLDHTKHTNNYTSMRKTSLYVYCDKPDESNHHQYTTASFIISYLQPTCNYDPHLLNLQPLHMKSRWNNGQVKCSFTSLPLT